MTGAATVCLIPGDDAAPEVVEPTVEVAEAAGAQIEWRRCDIDHREATRQTIDGTDTCLFGSASGRSTWALAYLRWGRRTYANLRPVRHIPGAVTPLAAPDAIDFVIVRENLEDLYVGIEGELADLARLEVSGRLGEPHEMGEGSYAIKAITDEGSRRVARAAFRLAEQRVERGCGRGHVTITSKTNMLPKTDGRFRDRCFEVAEEFPHITTDFHIIDDFARRLVAQPESLDVVVMPNLYGDILSDAAAGLSGGLGCAPSAGVGDDYAYFEPVHGSAPDIAGRGIINPTAQMLSAVMMLEHLGQSAAAARLEGAIRSVYRAGTTLTPDQGGSATTAQFTAAVLHALD
ncbi:MAG: isocitrate/isopropylmalate family dehydrogenase [Actinomycetota bacterium]